MKRKISWFLITAILTVFFVSCQAEENPPAIIGSKEPITSPSAFDLKDVPFFLQPGDKDTENCGQTSVLMAVGYLLGAHYQERDVVKIVDRENNWLADNGFGEEFRNPNGFETSWIELLALLEKYWKINSRPAVGTLEEIYLSLQQGRPAITLVTSGLMSSSEADGHWVVVVGLEVNDLYDPTKGLIWINDPGDPFGDHRQYSITHFLLCWEIKERVAIFFD